jgi:hypothetical protein
VTKDTPRLHYPQQESRYPTGWAPGPVWTALGKTKPFPTVIQTPSHLVRIDSLYRLHYCGPCYFKHTTGKIHHISILRISGLRSRSPTSNSSFWIDTSGSATAEKKIIHSVLKPQLQLHSYRHISKQPQYNSFTAVRLSSSNVPNDINPNVDTVANFKPLFANSMTITASSKMTVVEARNINTSKTCFVCSQNVA